MDDKGTRGWSAGLSKPIEATKVVVDTEATSTEVLQTALDRGEAIVILCRRTKEEITERLLLECAQVDRDRLHRGTLSDDEYERLEVALGRVNAAPIYLDGSVQGNRS